jgi:CubicO group peptidase (beta-lactamase class C family)
MTQSLQDYARTLEDACATTGVTGASFAYWDGETLHAAVAGVRNSVTRDPMTPDTVVHVGSVTKVMNAVLMLQLVDEGKIGLGDPVAKHLPELRLRDRQALERITCAMLINHTSGIDGMWLPEVGPDEERIVDTIERCADLGQLHVPGEAAAYCNVATVIAGYLTQKLRGESWYTVMKKRLYEPLELRHALVEFSDIPRFRCSVGDITDPKSGQLVQTTRPFLAPSFAPAGSTQMMTATDLVRFGRALLNGGIGAHGGRILSERAAALMGQPAAAFTPMPSSSVQAGLGWMILPGGVLYHGGGGPGVYAQLYAHPSTGRVLALLRNCDRGGALESHIVEPILQSWTGRQPLAPPARQSSSVDPRPYEGVYENIMYRFEVLSVDGQLALRMAERPGTRSYAEPLAKKELPPSVPLHVLGENAFEAEYLLPTLPRTELKFIQPDGQGRMRLLAFYEVVLLARS